jgi:hypothetical protein
MNRDSYNSTISKALVILIVATAVMMCLMAVETGRAPMLLAVGTPSWPECSADGAAMLAHPGSPYDDQRQTYMVANVAPFSTVPTLVAQIAPSAVFARRGAFGDTWDRLASRQSLSWPHMAPSQENILGRNDGKVCKRS